MKICIVGNSKRTEILRENLLNTEHNIFSVHSSDEIQENYSANFVVLPIPTADSNGYMNIPGETKINVTDFIRKFDKKTIFITCNYQSADALTIDLNKREDFAYLNAIPTAEGAIFYALEHTEKSLFESKALVTGFGRVAMILADRLKGLGCEVTVAARSTKALSHACALGYKTVNIKQLNSVISQFDIIFQTVPTLILFDKILENIKKDAVIIELSSRSAGTDYDFAASNNIKVVHAPALPEKISPITAGNILTKCVLSIISEHQ